MLIFCEMIPRIIAPSCNEWLDPLPPPPPPGFGRQTRFTHEVRGLKSHPTVMGLMRGVDQIVARKCHSETLALDGKGYPCILRWIH